MLISDLKKFDFKPIEAFKQIWTEPKYSYINRPRKNYGLLYVTKGKLTYKTESNIIKLGIGDIVFLRKGARYSVEFDTDGGTVEDFLLNFDILEGEASLNCGAPQLILHDASKTLKGCFMEISAAFANDESPFLIKSLFYRCLNNIMLLQHYKTASKDTLILEYAKNLITDFDELSIEEISQKLSMSHSTLQKKFKSAFGVTPIEYRVSKKIKKAKLWLSTTDIPIKEIAATLKYYDEAFFNKQFKKYCNITPKQYRERYFNRL